MIARIVSTLSILALAAGAFLGAAPTPASPLNPLGILFLAISGVVWLAWKEFREGFAYAPGDKGGVQLPLLVRFGPVALTGIVNKSEPPPALEPRPSAGKG